MRFRSIISAMLAAGLLLAPAVARAQASSGAPQGGSSGGAASGTGQLDTGPSASEQQRTNPPTSSNAPQNLSGGQPGSNTGAAIERVPQGAATGDRPGAEVPRSDSVR